MGETVLPRLGELGATRYGGVGWLVGGELVTGESGRTPAGAGGGGALVGRSGRMPSVPGGGEGRTPADSARSQPASPPLMTASMATAS